MKDQKETVMNERRNKPTVTQRYGPKASMEDLSKEEMENVQGGDGHVSLTLGVLGEGIINSGIGPARPRGMR